MRRKLSIGHSLLLRMMYRVSVLRFLKLFTMSVKPFKHLYTVGHKNGATLVQKALKTLKKCQSFSRKQNDTIFMAHGV